MSILADEFGPIDLAALRYGSIIEEPGGICMYLAPTSKAPYEIVVIRLAVNPEFKAVPLSVQPLANFCWKVIEA